MEERWGRVTEQGKRRKLGPFWGQGMGGRQVSASADVDKRGGRGFGARQEVTLGLSRGSWV